MNNIYDSMSFAKQMRYWTGKNCHLWPAFRLDVSHQPWAHFCNSLIFSSDMLKYLYTHLYFKWLSNDHLMAKWLRIPPPPRYILWPYRTTFNPPQICLWQELICIVHSLLLSNDTEYLLTVAHCLSIAMQKITGFA